MNIRRGAIVLFAWGLLDGIMTTVQLPFNTRAIMHAMLGTASILTMLTGVVVMWLDTRRRPGEPFLIAATEASFASALTGVGVAILLLGGAFGFWLALIAVGVLGFGIGGVIRETIARKQDMRELAARSPREWLAGRLYDEPDSARSSGAPRPAHVASSGRQPPDGAESIGGHA